LQILSKQTNFCYIPKSVLAHRGRKFRFCGWARNVGWREMQYEVIRDRVVTEFLRWLPALVFFAIYVATRNMLCLTYAIAFTLWPNVRAMSGNDRKSAPRQTGQEPRPALRLPKSEPRPVLRMPAV
jgi:hypothetical protein